MFGCRITLGVRHAFVLFSEIVCVDSEYIGRPPMSLTDMMPDRAGVKMTLWDWVKFAGIALWNLPALIASRPSVVDERLASVSSAITSREISV